MIRKPPVDSLAKDLREKLARGNAREAWSLAQSALQVDAAPAEIWNLAGAAALALGLLPPAERCFQQALARAPGMPEALSNLGRVFEARGSLDQAAQWHQRALSLRPDTPLLHVNFGVVCAKMGLREQAEESFRRALAIDAGNAAALVNLGWLRFGAGAVDEARALLHRALQEAPAHALGHYNLACIESAQGKMQIAEEHFRAAMASEPRFVQARFNLAYLLAEDGREAEAAQTYETILALDPQHHDARVNLAWLLLARGEYDRGFELYEARRQSQLAVDSRPPSVPFPEWRGEDLAGKSLLVWPEMKFGDEIVMVRYLRLLRERGAERLTLVCKRPLKPLFESLSEADQVLAVEELRVVDGHDYWVLQGSLPLRLGTRRETVPCSIPYLCADPQRKARWANLLPTARPRVGLLWKGSGSMLKDARSLAHLSELAPLWSVPGVQFVSLQKGRGEEEGVDPPPNQTLCHLGTDIGDFADSAAIISGLDLLISVDSAVVHLAGALGKPCWVLVPAQKAFWLWGREGNSTAWYGEGVRLFRQSHGEPWASVIDSVTQALAGWTAARC